MFVLPSWYAIGEISPIGYRCQRLAETDETRDDMTNQGRAIIGVLLLFAPALHGQQTTTTNTNCNVYGDNANCTSISTTTDNAAQQQQAYEAGQKVGDAIGLGLAAGIDAHRRTNWVKHFCAGHPGAGWTWGNAQHVAASGQCPTDESKALTAANTFMSRHKDFIKNKANSEAITAYLDSHNLDPREEKSYERAFKDLKKAGQLQLYSS